MRMCICVSVSLCLFTSFFPSQPFILRIIHKYVLFPLIAAQENIPKMIESLEYLFCRNKIHILNLGTK
jgi:hypothetical protein